MLPYCTYFSMFVNDIKLVLTITFMNSLLMLSMYRVGDLVGHITGTLQYSLT
jgi:hypothetical protein